VEENAIQIRRELGEMRMREYIMKEKLQEKI